MAEAGKKPWERTLQEAGARIEDDLKRLVTYLNDEVVPDVRRHGSEALRAAAVELDRLAGQLDDRRAARTGQAAPPPVDTARR